MVPLTISLSFTEQGMAASCSLPLSVHRSMRICQQTSFCRAIQYGTESREWQGKHGPTLVSLWPKGKNTPTWTYPATRLHVKLSGKAYIQYNLDGLIHSILHHTGIKIHPSLVQIWLIVINYNLVKKARHIGIPYIYIYICWTYIYQLTSIIPTGARDNQRAGQCGICPLPSRAPDCPWAPHREERSRISLHLAQVCAPGFIEDLL